MNMATAIVTVIVALVIIGATYGSYRMVKTGGVCAGCPKKGCCHSRSANPINCTIKKN